MPADEAAAPVAPTKKPFYKKPWLYIIIVLVLAAFAGAGHFLATEVFCKDEDDISKALENTFDAEFKGNEIINILKAYDEEKGLSLDAFVNIGSEVSTLPADISLQMSAEGSKNGNLKYGILIGSSKDGKIDSDNEKLLSFDIYAQGNQVALGSNLLGNGLYGTTVDENFVTNLKNSLIGQLLPEEVFNILGNIKPSDRDIKKAYSEFFETASATKTTSKEKIELDGKTVSVTAHTYTVTESSAAKLMKEIFGSSFGLSDDWYMGNDSDTVEGSDAESEASFTVKYYVKGKYVVKIDITDEEGLTGIIFG